MNTTSNTHRPALIFTDLDGTLLDLHSREWHAAEPALALTREHKIPVIPCSSKTFSECKRWVKQLNLTGPFIFENGGGVALPRALFTPPDHPGIEFEGDYWLYSLGAHYYNIRASLESLRSAHHYQFKGFGDMSAEQVCGHTGLTPEESQFAKARRHSEPLLWLDTAKAFDQFSKDVKTLNLQLTRGGRFIHITGTHDKGQAMIWLAALFYQKMKKLPFVIAAGDSDYDLAMLKIAHAAIIVRTPHAIPLEFAKQKPEQIVLTTEAIGPKGWNQAVISLLTKLYKIEPVY